MCVVHVCGYDIGMCVLYMYVNMRIGIFGLEKEPRIGIFGRRVADLCEDVCWFVSSSENEYF